MKSFTILCFIFLFSAFVFAAARAEEENETPAKEEPAAEVNDEQEPETETEENDEEETENDEEETENDEAEDESEEDEEEDVEKRSGYGGGHGGKAQGHYKVICPKKCWKVCKAKYCARRVCKQYQCGYRKVCHRVKRYKIVKRPYKVKVGGVYYYKYVIKYRTYKVPYYGKVCKKVAKYCTRCWVHKYRCGKRCRTVCKKLKCYTTKGGYGH